MKVRKKKKIPHFTYEHSPEMDEKIDSMLAKLEKKSFSANELLKELHEIAEHRPLYPTVFFALGIAYVFKNEHDESIQYFTKASKLNPFFVEAMFNNAVSHVKIGDIAGHLTWLSKVVEVGDKEDKIVIQAKVKLDEMDIAIRENYGIDLHAYMKNAKRFKFAQEKMQVCQWDKAIDIFKSLLKKTPDIPSIWNNLAICYANQGEKERALTYSKKALEIEEDYKPARMNLSLIEQMVEGKPLTSKTHWAFGGNTD
ncbi:TPA: tetratricopeptide repeat protein [Legionella pneumophila]